MTSEQPPESSWQDLLTAVGEMVGSYTQHASNVVSKLATNTEVWLEIARPSLQKIAQAVQQFQEAFDEGVPKGWSTLTVDEIFAVMELMEGTGWCLTTSPSARTLRAMLAVQGLEEKGLLLLAAEAEILNDLDVELRTTSDEDLALYASAARESWEAQASGFFLASQALSSASIGALSDRRGPFRFKNLGAARTFFASLDIEDTGLQGLRLYAVAKAVQKSLMNFPRDSPEPRLFNRHASAHALSSHQFTQLNSLTALMLHCGWLREVSWLLRTAQKESS